MFELFIALFGGLFLAGKYFSEKAAARSFDRRQHDYQVARDNIETKYAASYELEQWAKEFISSGEHFEEICGLFAEDFQYVFGDDWKNKLRIPPRPPVLDPKVYKNDAYSFLIPANHIYWVYHLMLAQKGKIDHWNITSGFSIGGIYDKDMNVKFAERIERRLLNAGVQGVKLVLELKDVCLGVPRTPENLCGGDIKIESLCHYPTHRLWGDNE